MALPWKPTREPEITDGVLKLGATRLGLSTGRALVLPCCEAGAKELCIAPIADRAPPNVGKDRVAGCSLERGLEGDSVSPSNISPSDS